MPPIESYWNDFLISFGRFTIATMAIPVFVAIFYRKYWNKPLRIVFYYCLVTLFVNLFEQGVIWVSANRFHWIKDFIAYFKIQNTFFLLILYYLKNFLLVGWFYSTLFPKNTFQRFIFPLSCILSVVALINHCFIEGYHAPGNLNPVLEGVFLILLPLSYLWYSRSYSLRIPLKKNPYLWISIGILLPELLSLFLDLTGDYIYARDFILYVKLYSASNVLDIIGNLFLSLGFFYGRYALFIPPDRNDPPTIGS
ncbi:hypothetical protein CRP01_23390 [Flavilitoribacter nigricans DSM 23189 = NBRC 102662]|uniref:Histidine kinase N-terminal 7TM region domain-containing protein n=1 Tax=Flavilitoribacter nigricans (strain ATCC 23147 / DSM 23189 / NBRC 102662 / NCIMB 1420 / SS-2) TaxID=1122177 RepID=A0A2D0N8P9_FLAN2|nr:hypothetical protein CRP01_23390 [Flavilitoribacter nigricans DSM 23189 = NBRC 102662]